MKENTIDQNKENKKKSRLVEIILIIIIIILLLGVVLPVSLVMAFSKGTTQDAELIKNLNTALKVDKDVAHHEHNNMTDALNAAENAGYYVARINATKTNNEILWDSKNDVFVYYNSEKEDIEYLNDLVERQNQLSVKNKEEVYYLWKLCDSKPTLNYSMYWIGEEKDIPAVLTSGFDSGKNEVKKELTYKTTFDYAQNVVIRTNSKDCVLNIDAPSDTVTHYGDAKTVNIIKVANHSYIEKGTTSLISVNSGRVVLSEDANVTGMHFNAYDSDNDGNKDKFEEIIVNLDEGADLPSFYRDQVVIDQNGTLVCKVETVEEEKFVWLEQQGIYVQITVSETEEASREWVSTSNSTTETKQISQDIANNLIGEVRINEETREIIPEEGKTVEEYVEEKGQTVEETQEIVDVKVNVQAYVEPHMTTTNDLAALYFNTQYSDKATADVAYRFNAFNEEENMYIDAFINAKENGKNIFTNHIEDYSNEAKINRALEVVEVQLGSAAR